MLFNSYIFILLFLPATLLLYFISKKIFGRESSFVFLILASLVYYAYWKFTYLPILLGSVVGNYLIGIVILKLKDKVYRRSVFVFGVFANLAALGYYKYADFIISNTNYLVGGDYDSLNILLPLAISFFTFQQIAYLSDVYMEKAKEYSFVHYMLFISFFPQLIAGPIVHHKEILPQFVRSSKKHVVEGLFWDGLIQFCFGLFKKVLIADTVALYASPVFSAADSGMAISMVEAWVAIFAYSFQLYFDFSGYSDMAIGIGKMFGIRLPENFNSPYKAKSISDFWRRWHMTLSRFLRDYLYVPLGGSQRGEVRRYVNLLVTMLLGGLWHGASWNFVLWGGIHGVYLVINQIWSSLVSSTRINKDGRIYCMLSRGLTFFAVIAAWVLFRAETPEGAMIIYTAALDVNAFSWSSFLSGKSHYLSDSNSALALLFACSAIVFWLPNSNELVQLIRDRTITTQFKYIANMGQIAVAAFVSGLLVLSLASMNKVSEFLYFQF